MSKNSFTENFNNCVAGLPIVGVAAHMVLHEGLLKDIGKVSALAGLGYLGYNYGDEIGNFVNKAGSAMGFGDHNVVGDTLGNWHGAAKTWLQDSLPGRLAGLGGEQALERHTKNDAIEQQSAALAAAKQQDEIQITRDNPDLATRNAKLQANEQKYNTMKQQIADDAWTKFKINRVGNTAIKDTVGDVTGAYNNSANVANTAASNIKNKLGSVSVTPQLSTLNTSPNPTPKPQTPIIPSSEREPSTSTSVASPKSQIAAPAPVKTSQSENQKIGVAPPSGSTISTSYKVSSPTKQQPETVANSAYSANKTQ